MKSFGEIMDAKDERKRSLRKPLTRQQMRIIDAGAEIAEQKPKDIELAYMAQQLVQATLPHADPGNVPSWWRKNGDLTLTITPGYDVAKCIGYPYGVIPRLLLFWITREVVLKGSPRLELGDSMAAFMRELGLDPSTGGGKRGDAKRLRDQMHRLFRARISFQQEKRESTRRGKAWIDMQVAPVGVLWWDEKDPEQTSLFGSWIELSPQFFEALRSAPVPIDMKALRALKGSALALDLYAWVCRAAFVATQTGRTRFISWELLMEQLGADYNEVRNFRTKAKAALRSIKVVYPGLRIGKAQGGIEILPGASAVPGKAARQKKG